MGILVSKIVVALSAFVAAIVFFISFWPTAYATIFWREIEYDILHELNAGNNFDYVVEKLGTPAFASAIGGFDGDLTEYIFQRRGYFVMTVTDSVNSVVLLSVLSCDPAFAPTFADGDIRLQSVPLSEADVLLSANESMPILVAPRVTASSAGQIVEELRPAANATGVRAQYVGVNSLCADFDALDLGGESFAGPLKESPASIANARDHIAANFYAETAGVEVTLSEDGSGSLSILRDGEWVSGVFATPLGAKLPHDLEHLEGTRTF